MASTIFIVDSSPAVRRLVEQISTPEGCDVVGFQDAPTALEAARRMSPHLIIADYHLENMTFSGFCKEIYKLDNLAETSIVSLISQSDRIDETHLRSLGVKLFLKKPFQSEDLIEVIKDLETQQASRTNGTKKKSRSWPPVSSATDSDDEDEFNDDSATEEEEQVIAPHPQPKEPPVTTTTAAQASIPEPEEAMKGLFGQLLQSMSERTEKNIADLLPQMVGKDLATLVAKAVETEVQRNIGAALTEERLTEVLEPMLVTALPKILSREMALLEPTIRQSIFDIASPLIKDRIDQLVLEQTNTVRTLLPDMVREQIGSIEELLKKEIQQAAAKQTAGMVEALVLTTAHEQVEEAVQRLVPGLAEVQIKTEIERLTQAA
ncbi:MAG: response regulator [Nitrospirota bacterium]|nr:response regulator [Nitrospirota bacterium]MDP2384489.1 response regulator [Nitrospirota bacterium]MDP3595430.1 response regulator [Nitrospirota bacterium]